VGLLDETGLDRLVAAGCDACGSHKLAFSTFVDGLLPIMAAEPVGKITWVYEGEKFVDGVFEVSCAACNKIVFAADVCPRCHSDGGLATALGTTNGWAVPAACSECEGEELRYIAMLPARVIYEGVRAEKPRSFTELYDEGFHGYRVDCKSCGTLAVRKECPLCEKAPPLRVRPG